MAMELQRVGWILILSALALVSTGFQFSSGSERTKSKQVTLRSKSDCDGPVHLIGDGIDEYVIVMKWTRYNCSLNERGFSCGQTFALKDNFVNLGTRLCVDIQGVQHDISGMNQLLVTIRDREGDLKDVYATTRLRPENKPYYVCTRPHQNSMSVSMVIRSSVLICPDVLSYMFTRAVRLGDVRAMPMNPIVAMDLGLCESEDIPRNESMMIKVNAEGTEHECYMRKRMPYSYSYLRGCLKLVYVSNDFDCEINVRLSSERNVDDEIVLSVDKYPGTDMQRCETFSGRNGYPVLNVKVYPYPYSVCRGQFALELDFRQTPPPDRDDEDSDKRSPNLYMAVFITLIAICLVCLGLTCLCCIRFRAKRLRRLQRRNPNRQVSVPNQGFQYDVPSAPQYDHISWSPTQPGTLYGLPTYDDVVAESSGGIHPSGDPNKDDLPPAYDSVCSASDS